MTDQEVLDQIAGEAKEGFSGSLSYSESKGPREFQQVPFYRVWNKNNFWDEAKDGPQPITPGMIMTTKTGEGKEAVSEKEIVEKIQAVILYTSHGRKFDTGSGSSFRTVCQSHDGVNPSIRVDDPLCREATKEDLVQILSGWKGADQAKIDANLSVLTQGTDNLQMCGLPTPKGNSPCITMCPHGKKKVTRDRKGNVLTTSKASCKPLIYVQAYDIKRKRQFKMELTGRAIENGTRFIAPFHEFFKYLTQGNGSKSFPSYAFVVDLYPAADGQYYHLGLSNWRPIADPKNRAEMESMAVDAKNSYEKAATRMSKEAYEKAKKQAQGEKVANEAVVPTTAAVASVPAPEPKPEAVQPIEAVSFDEDDIPF